MGELAGEQAFEGLDADGERSKVGCELGFSALLLRLFVRTHGNYCTAFVRGSGKPICQLIVFALMSKETIPVRVLVVDDDEVSREVLAVLLEGAGYAVTTADSGDAALLDLTAVGSPPDVVLVDMQMPGIAGGELARRLRDVCGAGTALLAMSGSEPAAAGRGGFDGFLLKPFTMTEFGAALDGDGAARKGTVASPSMRKEESDRVLNEAVYEKLAASMKRSQLEQLYAMCLEDVEKRIAGMRTAASRQDDATYKREAHAIKGGCGMVGATELQTLATTMEEQGMGVANQVAPLDEFLLACGRLRRILVARRRS
jgi:CheY-like chemotaxis protein